MRSQNLLIKSHDQPPNWPHRHESSAYFASADLLWMSSWLETSGLVLIRYLASLVPCDAPVPHPPLRLMCCWRWLCCDSRQSHLLPPSNSRTPLPLALSIVVYHFEVAEIHNRLIRSGVVWDEKSIDPSIGMRSRLTPRLRATARIS